MPVFSAAQEKTPELKGIVDKAALETLPRRYRKGVKQATMLFRFIVIIAAFRSAQSKTPYTNSCLRTAPWRCPPAAYSRLSKTPVSERYG
jgi:hypothetical protein